MKRLLLTLLFALLVTSAQAQWQVPLGQVPIGKGQGKTGFTTIGTGIVGQVLTSQGPGLSPAWGAGGGGGGTAVTITAGTGISLSGTCISASVITCTIINGGVTSLGGVTGAVTLGTSLSMVGSVLTGPTLGTIAAQNANNVTITGGSISGITDLAIADGGTGASTAANARTNLGLGTMAVQDASAVAITGGTVTGLPSPSAGTDAATKTYVDNVAASGLNPIAQSRLATAAVLPNTPTYSNGASGVGATLTAGANSTLTVDGVVAALADVVLVKNQASTFQNGIYTVTTAGSGAAAWVLTRATYFDIAAEMKNNTITAVTAGTVNTNTTWVMSPAVATVGTDASIWTLFSSAATSGIVIGTTTITGGTVNRIPFDNAGVIGEYQITGTGKVVMDTTPTIATPVLTTPAISNPTITGTITAVNKVTNNNLAQAAATTLKGVPDNVTANVSDFTLSGLTARGTPNIVADLLLIFDSASGTFKSIKPADIVQCPISAISSNTTITSLVRCQTILVDATSAAVTVTLYAASSAVNGNIVYVKKTDASTNNVTVATSSGNIDGFATISTNTRYSSFAVQVDSTQWWQL